MTDLQLLFFFMLTNILKNVIIITAPKSSKYITKGEIIMPNENVSITVEQLKEIIDKQTSTITQLTATVKQQSSDIKQLNTTIEQQKTTISRQEDRLSQKDAEIDRLNKAQNRTNNNLNVINSCFSEFNKDLGTNELIQRAQNITKDTIDRKCAEKTTEVNYYMPDGTGKFFTLNKDNERIYVDIQNGDNTAMAEALYSGKRTVTKTYNGQYDIGDGITEKTAKNLAVIPIKTDNSRIAGIAVIRNKSDLITQADVDTVNNVTRVFNSAFENRMLDAENKVLQTDKLTGLSNRHGIAKSLTDTSLPSLKSDKNVSVGFIDIDNFKKFNDTYGHDAGDKVLQHASNILKSECRSDKDCAFRQGGEEMGIIFDNANETQALSIMERVRKKFAETPCDIGNGQSVSVTISAGVAQFSDNERDKVSKNNISSIFEDNVLKRADERLYQSKENGKNQVTAGPEAMAELKQSQRQTQAAKFGATSAAFHNTPTADPQKKFGDLGE